MLSHCKQGRERMSELACGLYFTTPASDLRVWQSVALRISNKYYVHIVFTMYCKIIHAVLYSQCTLCIIIHVILSV